MKKLLFTLLLIVPFALSAQGNKPPTEPPSEPQLPSNELTEGTYTLEINIRGNSLNLPGDAETGHVMRDLPYATYTVAYAAAVDMLNELITKVWLLTAAEPGGVSMETLNTTLANPKSLICN